MTQEGWDTPRTDDDLAYEEAWEHARAQETEQQEEEERERAQTLLDDAVRERRPRPDYDPRVDHPERYTEGPI